MTSSFAKSKQIIGAHFQTFSTVFLIFDVPQYSHIFHYIKNIRPAIYFDNQKSLHIIFNVRAWFTNQMPVADENGAIDI